jgi:Dolichyl-phosphate-mannose-protein mannosyltransferase/F5/8 type C domain
VPPRPRTPILFSLALLTAVDFFLGGALSFPLLRFVPGVHDRHAGTVLLAGALVLLHLARYWRVRASDSGSRLGVFSPRVAVLACVVAYALWSRLATIGWDTTHGPDGYEEHFVSAVLRILKEGDLNHRYHEYPGLFLYMLLGAYLVAFVTAVGARLGTTLANIPAAHFLKMGRALVAGFGVLNVVLAYPLGRRWFNERVGLVASALVALSYLELYTSHYIRPDIVLETFFIGVLLAAFLHLERGTIGTALLAGAAVGAATAVKYTGFLGLPALLLALALAPASSGRWLRFPLALGALLLTYALLSPYTFLDLPGFLYGVAEQGLYNTDPSLQPAENMARYYSAVLARESIGYPALLLVLVGAARVMAAPRSRDLVALAFIVPYLCFFFAAPAQFDRFLLPAQPALAALAGHGLDGILGLSLLRGKRIGRLASAALVACVLVPPSLASFRYLALRLRPSVRDEAREWALERLPPGTRIGVSRLGPSFRDTPFVESRFVRLDESTFPFLAQFDFLVSAAIDDPDVLARFREIARFEPGGPGSGHIQVVYQVPDPMKPRYRRVPLEWQQIDTSFDSGEIPSLVDGDETTGLLAGEPHDRPQRIDVDLKESRRISLVVLAVPDDGVEAASRLRVQASTDGRNYFNARRFVLPESEPAAPGRSRVSVVLDSREARFLRFVEPRDGPPGLALSEIELYENEPR